MRAIEEFPVVIERGCGLDVHQKNLLVSIRGKDIKEETN
jgi:hypothetical protein